MCTCIFKMFDTVKIILLIVSFVIFRKLFKTYYYSITWIRFESIFYFSPIAFFNYFSQSLILISVTYIFGRRDKRTEPYHAFRF